MIDFTEKYSLLFYSLVFLCFAYAIFLVFYANDKIREIDKAHYIKSRQASKAARKEVRENTTKAKKILTMHCNKIMLFFLVIILIFNTVIIFVNGYNDIYGFIGGYAYPLIAYFIFVFFLLIAMGLNGASVLRTGQFFKGLEY
jgi:hypothetical protein